MGLIEDIKKLKKERDAVILAHNYQLPEVQDIADFTGDSLGLSIEAAKAAADIIVFCGVYFMAETAKILSPKKTVLIPDKNAGCPMADMINADQLRLLKTQHPRAKVVCYVNSTAEVKAESDLCCTSGNALKIMDVLKEEKEIIFVPDQHLADYVSEVTGRNFIIWKGFCPTHVKILPEHIAEQKSLHPNAEVIAHPECTRPVRKLADQTLSTEGMCRYAKEANTREFILATELGIIHRLKKENPGKHFYPGSRHAVCPNMKRINLEKILWSLEDLTYEVKVPEDTVMRARTCIEKMLTYA